MGSQSWSENQSGRMEPTGDMGGSEGSDLDELQLGGKYSSGSRGLGIGSRSVGPSASAGTAPSCVASTLGHAVQGPAISTPNHTTQVPSTTQGTFIVPTSSVASRPRVRPRVTGLVVTRDAAREATREVMREASPPELPRFLPHTKRGQGGRL
ncbi:uncharacterized protein EI90DRAFT_3084627 [Cantharellus anzutake]|uniref:uncharacterized protein n=1 Tax=Cantharellus anzutake TaxID=1750568 RepID=UPI001908E3F1|nr:uncharacterized protein EI90DRAFT_3084627 [Cantharellus anzutake]KAF8317834.1 hypothetical protein EI90DRAFT_3084627 [Cantharellus anzutake]